MLAARKTSIRSSNVWIAPDSQIGLHHFSYTRDQYVSLPHTHGEYCLVMCLFGHMRVLRADSLEELSAGELLIVNPGELHACRFGLNGSPVEGLSLILDRGLVRQFLNEMAFPSTSQGTFSKITGKIRDPEIQSLAHKLIAEYTDQQPGFGIVAQALMRQMMAQALRRWPNDWIMPARYKLEPQLSWLHMHRATEFMNTYGKGAFRLPDLCAELGVSHSRFNPLFKNSVGTSPHSFYNRLLVLKARRLLQNESYSIKEVAYELGFKSVSHFCSMFHRLTGVSPKSDSLLTASAADCDNEVSW